MKNRVFPAALIAAVLFIFAVRPAAAAPALWVVQSTAGKVYLFGTVHVLRDGTQWRSPEIEAAIKESTDLYLEIADVNDNIAAATSIFKIGLDRAHPLSTKISKADVALIDSAAKQYGLPGEAAFEPMRPWLAYMMLSVMPAMHSGYAPASGVDLQIRKEFADAGKPVRGFETFDMQAHIFADMTQTEQIALLESQLKSTNQQASVKALADIVNAWDSGDEDKLGAVMAFDKMTKSPTYPAMLANRNKAWATALAERLKQPGTSFVAVGAAHMLGADGVPALLQRMGFTVTRVQIAQTSPESTPPSPTPAASASPAPTPSASPTPIPQTLTPPAGWTAKETHLNYSGFMVDRMWIGPMRGVLIAGHLEMSTSSVPDLNALDAFFHQGLVIAAGDKGVQPSKTVKICNGKETGTYTTLTLKDVKEDVVLALSDRAYVAEYIRGLGAKDDPSATQALLTLCAP